MSADGPFGRRPGVDPPSEGESPEPRAPVEVPPPPRPPQGAASAVTWMLGVLVIVAMAYIAVNSLRTEGPGSRGLKVGAVLPAFAAVEVDSRLPDRDANIAADSSGGRRPACTVRGEGILNICELTERGPVVLAFTVDKSERCQEQVDLIEKVRPRFPGVQFAAVAIRGSREQMTEIRRSRGWKQPVGWDQDGAVANAYAVAVCPSVTFARVGGQVARTSLGFMSEAELARAIEEIAR